MKHPPKTGWGKTGVNSYCCLYILLLQILNNNTNKSTFSPLPPTNVDIPGFLAGHFCKLFPLFPTLFSPPGFSVKNCEIFSPLFYSNSTSISCTTRSLIPYFSAISSGSWNVLYDLTTNCFEYPSTISTQTI